MLFANDFINTEDIMDWIKVSIFTTSEGIEPLSGRLYQLGITGLEIEDEKMCIRDRYNTVQPRRRKGYGELRRKNIAYG